MRCSSCGAPLPAKSNLCRYCGLLNDTDLRALPFSRSEPPSGDRFCPRCVLQLETVRINVEGPFLVDRCAVCLGIFFDPGELEYLLGASVKDAVDVDFGRLNNLLDEQQKSDYSVTYLKCPVCLKLMNRNNYAFRSGVIVDRCKEHGVWLDGGELGVLLKWSKAGGKLHHQNRELERERVELAQKRSKEVEDRLQREMESQDVEISLFSLLGRLLR